MKHRIRTHSCTAAVKLLSCCRQLEGYKDFPTTWRRNIPVTDPAEQNRKGVLWSYITRSNPFSLSHDVEKANVSARSGERALLSRSSTGSILRVPGSPPRTGASKSISFNEVRLCILLTKRVTLRQKRILVNCSECLYVSRKVSKFSIETKTNLSNAWKHFLFATHSAKQCETSRNLLMRKHFGFHIGGTSGFIGIRRAFQNINVPAVKRRIKPDTTAFSTIYATALPSKDS